MFAYKTALFSSVYILVRRPAAISVTRTMPAVLRSGIRIRSSLRRHLAHTTPVTIDVLLPRSLGPAGGGGGGGGGGHKVYR